MRSNYKKLGNYIEQFDIRNKDCNNSLGLEAIKGISSISKSFIKTKANLVGVSPGNYKVVEPKQFGYNPNTARMGDKIPIALNSGRNNVLVSSIYPTFKIIEANLLLPEYLMMWFRRPEFDRYARFKSHGSAREIFDYSEMCEVELPVPSIEKQREIVKEYNTIVNRIKLNEEYNQKLEEMAQALFRHWFVDFEFPNENGDPYKTSGGKMVYNEQLDQEIPSCFQVKSLGNIVEKIISHRGKSKSHLDFDKKNRKYQNAIISAMNVNGGRLVKHNTIKYVNDKTFSEWMIDPLRSGDVILTSEAPMGEMLYIANRSNFLLSQRLFGVRVYTKRCSGLFLYFWLQTPQAKRDMEGRATGTTVLGIKLSELIRVCIPCAPVYSLNKFNNLIFPLMEKLESKEVENEINQELIQIVLVKMSKVETFYTEHAV